jgi:hypothetical protein
MMLVLQDKSQPPKITEGINATSKKRLKLRTSHSRYVEPPAG